MHEECYRSAQVCCQVFGLFLISQIICDVLLFPDDFYKTSCVLVNEKLNRTAKPEVMLSYCWLGPAGSYLLLLALLIQ